MVFEIEKHGEVCELEVAEIPRFMSEIYDEIAKDIKEYIIKEISRSVQLSAFVGQAQDPEAIKAIMRSIKVDVMPGTNVSITVGFEDDYASLYAGGTLPKDIQEKLDALMQEALDKWISEGNIENILTKALGD